VAGRAEFGHHVALLDRVAALLRLGAGRRWAVDGENGCSVTAAADEKGGRLAEYSAPRVRALVI
jgi:hypothetical protein